MLKARPSYVSIDAGGAFDRPCWIGLEDDGRTILWNGWIAFPFFDRKTAQLIIDEVERDNANLAEGERTHFEWQGHRLVSWKDPEPGDDNTYREDLGPIAVQRYSHDGPADIRYLYCIGGMSWVWMEPDFRCEPGCPAAAGGDHLEDCIAPQEEQPIKA